VKSFFKFLFLFGIIFNSCSQKEDISENFSINSSCRLLGGVDFLGNPLKQTYYCTIFNREFYIYIPSEFSKGDTSYPLLFSLHGYTSQALWNLSYTGFQSIADDKKFIVIYPQGSILNSTSETHWNVGGWTIGSKSDDINFINDLIDWTHSNYDIDLNRVYSVGMSNGGFMSYHLACNLSDRIAAIGSVTGSMTPETFEECKPEHPTPVIQIHGKLDFTVPYNGNSYMMSIDDVIKYWTGFNNCNSSPSNFSIEDGDGDDHGGLISRYENCLNKTNFELYLLDKLGHEWPGVEGDDSDIHSASIMWEFLSRYDINGLIE
jgi:polyhydroxybutyrate depolymerase